MEDYYDIYNYSTTPEMTTQDLTLAAVVLIMFALLMILVSVVMIITLWRIFTKAGKPGWASLVPIYNVVVMMEIVGRPQWWVVLMIIPIVNFVVAVIVTIEMAKAFGKSTGFGILMLFFPAIMYPILAFDSSQYVGQVAADQRPTPPAVGAPMGQ